MLSPSSSDDGFDTSPRIQNGTLIGRINTLDSTSTFNSITKPPSPAQRALNQRLLKREQNLPPSPSPPTSTTSTNKNFEQDESMSMMSPTPTGQPSTMPWNTAYSNAKSPPINSPRKSGFYNESSPKKSPPTVTVHPEDPFSITTHRRRSSNTSLPSTMSPNTPTTPNTPNTPNTPTTPTLTLEDLASDFDLLERVSTGELGAGVFLEGKRKAKSKSKTREKDRDRIGGTRKVSFTFKNNGGNDGDDDEVRIANADDEVFEQDQRLNMTHKRLHVNNHRSNTPPPPPPPLSEYPYNRQQESNISSPLELLQEHQQTPMKPPPPLPSLIPSPTPSLSSSQSQVSARIAKMKHDAKLRMCEVSLNGTTDTSASVIPTSVDLQFERLKAAAAECKLDTERTLNSSQNSYSSTTSTTTSKGKTKIPGSSSSSPSKTAAFFKTKKSTPKSYTSSLNNADFNAINAVIKQYAGVLKYAGNNTVVVDFEEVSVIEGLKSLLGFCVDRFKRLESKINEIEGTLFEAFEVSEKANAKYADSERSKEVLTVQARRNNEENARQMDAFKTELRKNSSVDKNEMVRLNGVSIKRDKDNKILESRIRAMENDNDRLLSALNENSKKTEETHVHNLTLKAKDAKITNDIQIMKSERDKAAFRSNELLILVSDLRVQLDNSTKPVPIAAVLGTEVECQTSPSLIPTPVASSPVSELKLNEENTDLADHTQLLNYAQELEKKVGLYKCSYHLSRLSSVHQSCREKRLGRAWLRLCLFCKSGKEEEEVDVRREVLFIDDTHEHSNHDNYDSVNGAVEQFGNLAATMLRSVSHSTINSRDNNIKKLTSILTFLRSQLTTNSTSHLQTEHSAQTAFKRVTETERLHSLKHVKKEGVERCKQVLHDMEDDAKSICRVFNALAVNAGGVNGDRGQEEVIGFDVIEQGVSAVLGVDFNFDHDEFNHLVALTDDKDALDFVEFKVLVDEAHKCIRKTSSKGRSDSNEMFVAEAWSKIEQQESPNFQPLTTLGSNWSSSIRLLQTSPQNETPQQSKIRVTSLEDAQINELRTANIIAFKLSRIGIARQKLTHKQKAFRAATEDCRKIEAEGSAHDDYQGFIAKAKRENEEVTGLKSVVGDLEELMLRVEKNKVNESTAMIMTNGHGNGNRNRDRTDENDRVKRGGDKHAKVPPVLTRPPPVLTRPRRAAPPTPNATPREGQQRRGRMLSVEDFLNHTVD